jgi:transcriptional regulator
MSHIVYARDAAREERQPVLLEAMRTIHLAALVTSTGDGGLKVSHMPLLSTEAEDGSVKLTGHFARANDHWKIIEQGNARSVAIFQGPHTYMSPSNYASKQKTGKVVPTWTYIIVHAHGLAQTHHDADWLLARTNQLTDHNEGLREAPWKVSDAPDDYVATMLRGIVGFELTVSQLEGVWKLNQHRCDADKASMVSGLTSSDDERDRQIGAAMKESFSGSS